MDEEILNYCYENFPAPNNGKFDFDGSERLITVSSNVQNKPGVYVIYSLDRNGAEKLVYIGKAGTMLQSGAFRGQGLNIRINNVVGHDQRREDFFIGNIERLNLQKITIYWFVTHNNVIKLLPAYVEAELLQKYYHENNKLPEWNTEF